MIEVEIKGKRKLCFLVKKGEVNDIVIPLDSLVGIDYKRLSEMESQGGDLMKTMRETTLSNGKNALVQYQTILITVPKKVEKEEPKVEATTDEKVEKITTEPTKRGRGRPKKNQ